MNYSLENENLVIQFSTLGGGIVSIKDRNDIEYLWQGDSKYWSGQAPVMFPICGSIRDNHAQIGNGMTCTMDRHGIVRKLNFAFIRKTEDSITFSIQSNEELKAKYPYDFELQITYMLKDKTLTTLYQVFNQTSVPMPYFIGGHPGFNCPILPGEKFEDYVIEFEKQEYAMCPESIPSTGLINVNNRSLVLENESVLPLKHEYFNVDGLIFDQLRSRSAKLVNPNTGRGVQIDFFDFSYFILWSSANQGPFIALEPWSGISTCNDESDVFEEKRGVTVLPANQTKEHSFDITIL